MRPLASKEDAFMDACIVSDPAAVPASDFLALQALGVPLVVSYGAGVDSTAMLVGMWARGIRPDLILFADTGSEQPSTYAYLFTMQSWLESVGFPSITVVRRTPPKAPYTTLEGQCEANAQMPSLAYGGKSCSIEWKAKPQHKFLKTWAPALACWARGEKVCRAIGFDDSGADQKRSAHCNRVQFAIGLDDSAADRKRARKARSRYAGGGLEADKFAYSYPLQEWNWNREQCIEVIRAAGLPVPIKSSCYFCPAMKKPEVVALATNQPALFAKAVAIEARWQASKNGPAERIERGKKASTLGLGRRFAWGEMPADPAEWDAWAAPKRPTRKARKATAVKAAA